MVQTNIFLRAFSANIFVNMMLIIYLILNTFVSMITKVFYSRVNRLGCFTELDTILYPLPLF